MQGYEYVPALLTAVVTTVVGILVAWHAKDRSKTKIFIAFIIVLSVWLLGSALIVSRCGDIPSILFIDRIIYSAATLMPAALFHFAAKALFTSQTKLLRNTVISTYIISGIFAVAAWTPWFIAGVYQFENGCHSKAQVLHHLFLLYFFGYGFALLAMIYRASVKAANLPEKGQLQFTMLSLAAQLVTGVSAFLPAYNINSFVMSYIAALVTAPTLVYAMFRQNLAELRLLIVRIFIVFVISASFIQLIIANTFVIRLVNIVVLLLTFILGFVVTKNVRAEIRNREQGERLSQYLANANARLRVIDQQKTEFVSVASHQLRSPIAAIKGYSSMILEGSFGDIPDHLKEPLNRILESGNRIAIMVDDFLNVTRIEQGRMVYAMKRHDVRTLVKSVVDELQVVAENKGLAFEYAEQQSEPLCVNADEGKLKQIFSNLIDNAIKYTREGWIRVEVQQLPEHKTIVVNISDSGIGIAPEEQAALFQKFNRASNANDASVYGTGLGLYIAREIMKAHNGWIHVSSPGVGLGSTFTDELPVATDEPVPAPAATPAASNEVPSPEESISKTA